MTDEKSTDESKGPLKVQRRIRAYRLQRRFLVGLGLIFLCFCLISAYFIFLHEKNLLVETTYQKSQIVMAAVEANRSYVREVLRPKMYDILGDEGFVIEAMSTSYVSREVMERFKNTTTEYQYRRVAFHSRNPAFEPNELEKDLITFFTEHPEQRSKQGIIKNVFGARFIYAHPVYFTKSCMHCHGDPADAPQTLIDLYGSERGFGHQPDEIAGVTSVSIPVDVALDRIKERAFSFFWVGLLCLSMLYFMISFLFNRLVVHNLKDLLEIFQINIQGEKELQLLKEAKAKDEIGELTKAAQSMAIHLRNTHQELEKYAQNLEEMVTDRTVALEESKLRLREKVAARNQELQMLNVIAELITRSVSLADILPSVLKQTLRAIPARGAALYLLRNNPSRLELQCHENAENLIDYLPFNVNACNLELEDEPTDLPTSLSEAACGHVSRFLDQHGEQNGLNVPLCCRDKILGVMAFVDVDVKEITSEMHQLIFSIGRQVGVTVESLQNTEKLLQSKELLQTVFDGITDMLVLLDRKLRMKMVNKAHLQYFGVTLKEALNRPCVSENVKACQSCPFGHCNINAVIESKKPMSEEIQSNKGEIFLVHYFPIFDDNGAVESIVRYAKDITSQKRVEQKIQQTEKLVSLGQLAAGVAHEINNPLGVILCYTELLKRQLSDSPRNLLDVLTIEKHAVSCQKIVSDMLKFARTRESERQLALVNQSIEETVRMIDRQFRKEGVEIELDLESDMPLLNMDKEKMKQVYINLLMNARQAMGGCGTIRICSKYLKNKGHIKIVFWDNGNGIAPQIITRIFDPFFTTKKTGEGSGLGLSVTYGIVKDHGGDIRVDTEPGRWTQFTILLPVDSKRK